MGREGEEEGRAIRKVDRMWRTAESAFPVVQPDRAILVASLLGRCEAYLFFLPVCIDAVEGSVFLLEVCFDLACIAIMIMQMPLSCQNWRRETSQPSMRPLYGEMSSLRLHGAGQEKGFCKYKLRCTAYL